MKMTNFSENQLEAQKQVSEKNFLKIIAQRAEKQSMVHQNYQYWKKTKTRRYSFSPNCCLSQTVMMIKLLLTRVYATLYSQIIVSFTFWPLHLVLPWHKILCSLHTQQADQWSTNKHLWTKTYWNIGHLAGSVGTVHNSWSQSRELEPRVGHRAYLKIK